MQTIHAACPDHDSLSQFLLGKIAGSEAELLDAHLLACEKCAREAKMFSIDDQLTEAVRTHLTIVGDDELVAQVVERAKHIFSDSHTQTTTETVIGHSRKEFRLPIHNLTSKKSTSSPFPSNQKKSAGSAVTGNLRPSAAAVELL